MSMFLYLFHFTGTMAGEDKPPNQSRQRKKGKKSRSKEKSPGNSPSAHLQNEDDLLVPPVLQPTPQKKKQEEKPKVAVAKVDEESSIAICLQVLFPYLLAGMGMVMAGMVLDMVQVSEKESVSVCGSL